MTYQLFKRASTFLAVLGFMANFFIGLFLFPCGYRDAYGGTVYFHGIWGARYQVKSIGGTIFVMILLMAATDLLLMVLFEIVAKRKHGYKISLLYDRLSVQDFLEEYRPIIEQMNNNARVSHTLPGLWAQLHYARGLVESGNIDSAVHMLKIILYDRALLDKRYADVKGAAYLAILRCQYLLGNPEAAKDYAEKLQSLYEGLDYSNKKRTGRYYPKYIAQASAAEAVFSGSHMEVLSYFHDTLAKSTDNLQRLHCHCYLAVLYNAHGERESACQELCKAHSGERLHSFIEAKKRCGLE